jgi:hypothetical protein
MGSSPAVDRLKPARNAGTLRRYSRRHDRERTGNPHDTEPWEWRCGFYPGSRPGECSSGTADTFDEARAGFEAAWRVFLSNRIEADFQALRNVRTWPAMPRQLAFRI